MFDTIAGLPLHPLVVHAVVVLLPLAALLTVAVAVRAAWRALIGWVVLLDAAVVVATFTAVESGEKFQSRLSALRGGGEVAATHAQQGKLLLPLSLGVLVAGLIVLATRSRSGLRIPVALLAAVVGVAAVAWVVVVGHSGATDVWGYVAQTK